MRKKKFTGQRKVDQKGAPEATNAPQPSNPSNIEVEQAFWWMIFERREFLKERIEKWECNDTNDLATKEHRLAVLHTLLDEVEELIRLDSVDPKSKELLHLKDWHRGATRMRRAAWVRSVSLVDPQLSLASDTTGICLDGTTKLLRKKYAELYDKHGKPPSQRELSRQTNVSRNAIRSRWRAIEKVIELRDGE
ncbi:MAG: hypothetical protein WD078_14345 [Woeseia sp.]